MWQSKLRLAEEAAVANQAGSKNAIGMAPMGQVRISIFRPMKESCLSAGVSLQGPPRTALIQYEIRKEDISYSINNAVTRFTKSMIKATRN